jgi:hypothetical protein
MTICRHIRTKLTAYLEDDLPLEEKTIIETHLASCAACRAALSGLKKTTGLVQKLEDVEPPPWLTRKIMTLVREEPEQRVGIFQRLFYPLRIKIPVQVFAALTVAVLGIYVYKATGPEIKEVQAPRAAEKVAPSAEPHRKPVEVPRKTPQFPKEPPPQQTPQPETGIASSRPMRKEVPSPEQRINTNQETKIQNLEEAPTVAPPRKDDESISRKQSAAPFVPSAKDKGFFDSTDTAVKEISKNLGAAPPSKSIYTEKPAPVTLTLQVKNVQSATAEVIRLANRLGGTGTTAKSTPSAVFLSTVLPAHNFTIFLERVTLLGTLKQKGVQTKQPQEDISLHIEILGDS